MYEVHNGDFAAAIKKLDDEALERMKKEALASAKEHDRHSKSGSPKHGQIEQTKTVTKRHQSRYGSLAGVVLVMIVIMILTSSLKIIPLESRMILPLLAALCCAWIFQKKIKK